MSAQLTWRALDEAGEAWTAANPQLFCRKSWLFGRQRSFGLAICPRERYYLMKPVPKKEIPVEINFDHRYCRCMFASADDKSNFGTKVHRIAPAKGWQRIDLCLPAGE